MTIVMLKVAMLCVAVLNVIMLNVTTLSVAAPRNKARSIFFPAHFYDFNGTYFLEKQIELFKLNLWL
jgi:hypothetical protein